MESSEHGTRMTGGLEWKTFPRSVSAAFAIKSIRGNLYRVITSPNLPYAGTGRMPGQIELSTANDFKVEYADGYRFEAKLVGPKTLVMEASMPINGGYGIGAQLAPVVGPSEGGSKFVPFAYFLCQKR